MIKCSRCKLTHGLVHCVGFYFKFYPHLCLRFNHFVRKSLRSVTGSLLILSVLFVLGTVTFVLIYCYILVFPKEMCKFYTFVKILKMLEHF